MPHLLPPIHILLADDDKDDCLLFKEALDDLPLATHLTMVRNGEQLMKLLGEKDELPDMLFLDLNMPRKNGFDCLFEIKQSVKLKPLPVIIFTTSFDPDMVNLLYRSGARHYICKPNSYDLLLKIIHHTVTIVSQGKSYQPVKEQFVISPESCYNESPISNG